MEEELQNKMVFIGDSPNDAPMFGEFENSFAVSNIKNYLSQIEAPPKYITTQPNHLGFLEFIKTIQP